MKKRDLPPRVYEKHGAFYFVKDGKWHNLGRDRDKALELAEIRRLETFSAQSGMVALLDAAEPVLTRSVAPATALQYRKVLKRLRLVLVEFKPEDVRPKHVAQIKRALGSTPNMANRVLTVLRLVFSYAVEEQLVEGNPCIGIKRYTERKRDRYLSDAEFAAIRANGSSRFAVTLDLLYLTGQRVSDVLKLRRDALLAEGVAFRQGKTGARLIVQWNPDLRAAVDAALALHPVPSLTLFRTRFGGPPSYTTFHDQWLTACAKAGVPDAHIHDVRAKSLTDAKRQGHDATALAGHADPRMTDRYIRAREVPIVIGPTSKRTA